jgi:hypothetical protein
VRLEKSMKREAGRGVLAATELRGGRIPDEARGADDRLHDVENAGGDGIRQSRQ